MKRSVDFLEGFREHLSVIRGRRPGTVKRYVRAVEVFHAWLEVRGARGASDVSAVLRDDVEAWLKDLFYHHGNLKNVSRAGKLSAIKSFWRFLFYKHFIIDNPMELIPSPRVQRPMPQKFSTGQLQKIFTAPDRSVPLGVRDFAILELLYATGPRVDEVRRLSLEDLTPQGNGFLVRFFTKGGKERLVPMGKTPSASLMAWLAIREAHAEPSDEALFVSMARNMPCRRMSVGAYNEVLKRAAAHVGITNERVFVHKVRATYATDLYDMGYGIKEISLLMGHNSVATTERYIAISETALKKTRIPERRWRELEKGGKSEGGL